MNKKLFWLSCVSLVLPILAGCNTGEPDDGLIHVKFDISATTLTTNKIKEQTLEKPGKVKKPVLVIRGENPENVDVYGWYTENSYEYKWDFKTDIVEKSMTLYAKFVRRYTVKYYQGLENGNFSYMVNQDEQVFINEAIPERSDLAECYANKGLYYLSNVQEQEDGTFTGIKGEQVDFENDRVNQNIDLLYVKSEEIYFTPEAIKNRFSVIAANEGNDGSTPGSIEVVPDEKDGGTYAKVDFGFAKTVADPRILIDNPPLDVSKSQFLQFKMKNIGKATSISFYWVGKWKQNDQWINGKEYHSFGQDRYFCFSKDPGSNTPYDEERSVIYKDTTGATYLSEQDPDSDWVTYTIPIALSKSNGVSTWGNAGKITALAIQSGGFKAGDLQDGENVLLIKEIKGVAATSYNGFTFDGFNDSSSVKNIKKNDSDTNIASASSKQSQIDGYIFPKNLSLVDEENSSATAIYKKTDSVAIYGSYTDGIQKLVLKPNTSRPIDLNQKTSIEFNYKNYSYVKDLTITIITSYTDSLGRPATGRPSIQVSMGTKMSNFITEKLNMFGKSGYKGSITAVEFSFTPVGVDNYIKIGSLKFLDYEAPQAAGLNFNDRDVCGFTSVDGISLTYDVNEKATKFLVTDQSKSVEKVTSGFNTGAYSNLVLTYTKQSEGISKVIVEITTDAGTETLTFDVSARKSKQQVNLPITKQGEVSKYKISFEGTGTIYLLSLLYKMPVGFSLDMSTGEYSSNESVYKGDLADGAYTYNERKMAMEIKTPDKMLYSRLGIRNIVIDGKTITNMSMTGKTKVAIIYQNKSSTATFEFNIGVVKKSDKPNNYLTCEGLPKSNDSTLPSQQTIRNVKTNMGDNDWDVKYYSIDEAFTGSGENEYYLCTFMFASPKSLSASMFIRGFALL